MPSPEPPTIAERLAAALAPVLPGAAPPAAFPPPLPAGLVVVPVAAVAVPAVPPVVPDGDDTGAPQVARCPICLNAKPTVILLPCGHLFCRPCLRQATTVACPVCRGVPTQVERAFV